MLLTVYHLVDERNISYAMAVWVNENFDVESTESRYSTVLYTHNL
jgi:hypothetical protein